MDGAATHRQDHGSDRAGLIEARRSWAGADVEVALGGVELGSQAAGPVSFQWDGLKDDGQFASPGTYFVSAEASVDGRTEAVDTLLESQVRSVTLSNSGGLLLDLEGVGSLDFSEVQQIL